MLCPSRSLWRRAWQDRVYNTTPDLQDHDQDRFFWSQTGLVLRPTVSDHITDSNELTLADDAIAAGRTASHGWVEASMCHAGAWDFLVQIQYCGQSTNNNTACSIRVAQCNSRHRVITWDYPGLYRLPPPHGWRFGVAVTRWSRSTQLLYIEPG